MSKDAREVEGPVTINSLYSEIIKDGRFSGKRTKELYKLSVPNEEICYSLFQERLRNGVDPASEEMCIKNSNINCIILGKKYFKIKDICKEFNFRESTFKRKHENGMDPEVIISFGKIIYENQLYSKKEFYNLIVKGDNITQHAFYKLYDQGIDPKEIEEHHLNSRKKFIIGDKEYLSLRDAHDDLMPNASLKAVRKRLTDGRTLEEAFDLVKRDNRRKGQKRKKTAMRPEYYGKAIVVFDKEYKSKGEAAAAYDIKESTFRSRLQTGITAEEAVGGLMINYDRGKVTVEGIDYKSASAAFHAYEAQGRTEITYPAFETRRQNHPDEDIEAALGIQPRSKEIVTLLGKERTYDDIANEYGVTRESLKRKHKNRTMEEIVENLECLKHIDNNYVCYSEKAFADNPELKTIPAILYFLELQDIQNVTHKVGITRRTVAERFNKLDEDEYRIVFEYKASLYECFQIEQCIMDKFSRYKELAPKCFPGRTETFKLEKDEQVESVINAIKEIGIKRAPPDHKSRHKQESVDLVGI